MATNFRINIYRNNSGLHLKLSGDFDGTSAHELLNVLEGQFHDISKIFIHTEYLKQIHPFGRDIFRYKISIINRRSVRLVFTGENASQFAF